MKILQINSVYGIGSTGRIAADIGKLITKNGDESFAAYGYGVPGQPNTYKMQGKWSRYYSAGVNRLLGKHGFYNHPSTRKLIRWIEKVDPDVIHLHNLHGYYINIKLLFDYLEQAGKPVIWTLHDCWSFTGHCPYFDMAGCGKWKEGCGDCPQLRVYPKSMFFDRSKESWKEKNRLFTSLSDMTIVTPSKWLADLAGRTFLKKYPIRIIPNGIDLSEFKPTPSDLKIRLGIDRKKVILGIAETLDDRKGGRYLVELAKKLGEDFVVLMLSLSAREALPSNVIALKKTNSKSELAEIYSAADVFVNPTLQDNFPTVNLEAMACGTPVVTFRTGGSPEALGGCGYVAERGDLPDLLNGVLRVTGHPPEKEKILAQAALYDREDRFSDYIKLYHKKL